MLILACSAHIFFSYMDGLYCFRHSKWTKLLSPTSLSFSLFSCQQLVGTHVLPASSAWALSAGFQLPCSQSRAQAQMELVWLRLLLPVLLCVSLVAYLYSILWLRPERLRQKLRSQGVKGPKPSFLFGNIQEMRRIQQQLTESHQEQEAGITDRFSSNYVATLFPYFLHWSRVYGMLRNTLAESLSIRFQMSILLWILFREVFLLTYFL